MALSSTLKEETINRFHWKIEVVGGLSLLFAALDTGILSFALTQLVGVWSLSPLQTGTIVGAQGAGMFFGGLFLGNAADRIGRLAALRLSLLAMAVGSILSAASWDYISLSAFQFVVGLGTAGAVPAASAFVGELSPARYRGMFSALLEMFWVAGSLITALAVLFILPGFGWRLTFVFGAVPVIWAAVQSRFMAESPRYLIARGKRDEALQFLAKVKERYGLSYDHLLDQHAHEHKGLLKSVGELWRRPLIRRTICTWLLWFVLVFTNYGVLLWLPTLLMTSGLEATRSIHYMLVFVSAQIPAVLAAAFLADVIGRKGLLVPALLACGVASYMFGKGGSTAEVLFWGSVWSLTNVIGYATMICYTSELFPTRLRGTGAGSASAFGRLGAVIAPFAMALLIGSWNANYEVVFIMFAAVLIVGALVIALLGEETKGRTLEEIAA